MESHLQAVPATTSGEQTRTFEELVAAEHARLFRVLFLIAGNRAEAEEVMQDAFLAVWERGAGRRDGRIPLATYSAPR